MEPKKLGKEKDREESNQPAWGMETKGGPSIRDDHGH
jgi:hypothetical protein